MATDYEIVKQLCESRISTRSFSDKPVSEEFIEKILDIAKTSPYASGQTNWDIQVITNKDAIASLAECVRQKTKELEISIREDLRQPFANYAKSFSFFENAPVLLILTFRVSPTIRSIMGNDVNKDLLNWERDNFTKSISCVAMLILLAAESLGLGACYMTGPVIAQYEIMKLVQSKPGREIGAIIPIGYKITD